MDDRAALPEILLDPRPVLAVGIVVWTIGLVVSAVVFDDPTRKVALCAVGIGVGVAGYAVYLLQKRAVQRGDRTAQEGIEAG